MACGVSAYGEFTCGLCDQEFQSLARMSRRAADLTRLPYRLVTTESARVQWHPVAGWAL